MSATYDTAVTELYRVPVERFVEERKRLAGELAQAGDKAAAALLGKLTRPSVSAWAVNQLWWEAREDFEALFATGERVRAGELGEMQAYRRVTNQLLARAEELLKGAGHSAGEATLRRVGATLAALAASGGFEPDPPGALKADRDPPGFEAMAGESPAEAAAQAPPSTATPSSEPREARETKAAARERARAEAAAAKALAEEKKRRELELRRLEANLSDAQREVARVTQTLEQRKRAVEEAEDRLAQAQTALGEAEASLAALTTPDA